MIQKVILTLFLWLNFTINIFASDVVFEFYNRGGNFIPKLYDTSGNHLFYSLKNTQGVLLPTQGVSFEINQATIIQKSDSLIVVYPKRNSLSNLEIIVKYNGKIIKKQSLKLVHFSPPRPYISYDSLGQRELSESRAMFPTDKLYLQIVPDMDFKTICSNYKAGVRAEITIFRKGEMIFHRGSGNTVNLSNVDIRTGDKIHILITRITLINSSDFCIPTTCPILKKDFEFVVR